jgi:predicted ATPase
MIWASYQFITFSFNCEDHYILWFPRKLRKNHSLFEQYIAVVQALAANQPLLLLLEDLHWAAPSSISMLFHLGRHLGGSRILVVGTYRPEDVAVGWKKGVHPLVEVISEFKRNFGEISLDLDQAIQLEGRHFIDTLLDTEPNRLEERFRQILFQYTGGHPLFTIELLRDMQERGDLQQDPAGAWVAGSTLDWTTLPPRVEGVIQKRIGRLPTELRRALRVASVEGETFTAEVMARVQAVDEQELIRRLSAELVRQHRLVTSPSVEWVGSRPLSRYRFRHHVFQQYLYQTLDEVERMHLHQAVGRTLETLYGEQVGRVAGQLAQHFQTAGNVDKALDYFTRAGTRACRLSAYEEAIDQLQQGLVLLYTLPDTPERAERELALQIPLAKALAASKG